MRSFSSQLHFASFVTNCLSRSDIISPVSQRPEELKISQGGANVPGETDRDLQCRIAPNRSKQKAITPKRWKLRVLEMHNIGIRCSIYRAASSAQWAYHMVAIKKDNPGIKGASTKYRRQGSERAEELAKSGNKQSTRRMEGTAYPSRRQACREVDRLPAAFWTLVELSILRSDERATRLS